tara:strand:- start:4368 stop:5240 length:873 start_codon:yes stop_codon:yes gene_type:complete
MTKLSLGTVQFGLNYGVANQVGKIKFEEVKKIIEFAKKSKISLIDTAVSYGDSEKIIGDIGIRDFKFVSKLPSIPKNCLDIDLWVEKNIKNTLMHLGLKTLYGLLVHNYQNLTGRFSKKLINALNRLKIDGLVKKIGISIYDPSEYEKIVHLNRFDIVQAPLNIIDRRLVESGLLSKLYSQKIEVHTRSVFLQGLLLMPREKIPKNFNRWSKIWDKWSSEIKKNKLDVIETCLLYPLSIPEIDHVIVGVDNVNQLKDIIKKSKSQNKQSDMSFMISNDQLLINPTNWNKL